MMRNRRTPTDHDSWPAAARLLCAMLLGAACATALNAAHRPARAAEISDTPTPESDKGPPSPSATLEQQEPFEPARLIGQTLELMQIAGKRLAANQLDEETGRVQQQIQDQLARLLKLAEQQAAPSTQMMPEEQPPDSSAPNSAADGGAGTQQSQSSQAGESSEPPRTGGELTQDEVRRRKDLATAVWGHLPPRLRDSMHGAFSERFLPQYDELVRTYYEALATQDESRP